MRLISLTSLLALCLLVVGVRAEAPPAPEGQADIESANQKDPPWRVKGIGKTQELADNDALTKAQEKVDAYLSRQDPTILWRPSLEYINANLAHRDSDSAKPEKYDDPVGVMQTRTLQVDIGPKELQGILEQDRQARIQQRDFLLGKLLVGLLAVLIAVAGYFRLEDWTKGYLTGVLRVGAVLLALAGIVGSGYWILH